MTVTARSPKVPGKRGSQRKTAQKGHKGPALANDKFQLRSFYDAQVVWRPSGWLRLCACPRASWRRPLGSTGRPSISRAHPSAQNADACSRDG
jgi:hypothetical protein